MGLLYLLAGLACGIAVGVGIKKRDSAAPGVSGPDMADPDTTEPGTSAPEVPVQAESLPEAAESTTAAPLPETTGTTPAESHEDEGEPTKHPRFPDVEYDLEPDDL